MVLDEEFKNPSKIWGMIQQSKISFFCKNLFKQRQKNFSLKNKLTIVLLSPISVRKRNVVFRRAILWALRIIFSLSCLFYILKASSSSFRRARHFGGGRNPAAPSQSATSSQKSIPSNTCTPSGYDFNVMSSPSAMSFSNSSRVRSSGPK